MARKKKRRKKQGLFSKAINAALIALGFARPISILLGRGFGRGAVTQIINEATFGLVVEGAGLGRFDLNKGLGFYAPAGAAIGLGKLKQYLMRHFPVR